MQQIPGSPSHADNLAKTAVVMQTLGRRPKVHGVSIDGAAATFAMSVLNKGK